MGAPQAERPQHKYASRSLRGVDRGIVQATSNGPPSSRHVRLAFNRNLGDLECRWTTTLRRAARCNSRKGCAAVRRLGPYRQTRMLRCAPTVLCCTRSTLLDSLELELVDERAALQSNLRKKCLVRHQLPCPGISGGASVDGPQRVGSATYHPRVLNADRSNRNEGFLAVTGRDPLPGGMIGVPHLPRRKRHHSHVSTRGASTPARTSA